MEQIFISDFFKLNNKLDKLGVFDALITSDSNFYINFLRLKETKVPEFINSYKKIDDFFGQIMMLLSNSKEKGDKFYRAALGKFSFSGVKGINLGFSTTGIDAGFGRILSKKVIDDAFDIIKAGCKQPELFQLVRLFEENIAADRLSDMAATLINEDIITYTKNINKRLKINEKNYPNIKFIDGIAINPYKNCLLLYLPKDILHKLPIANSWDDLDSVISENAAIRDEINDLVGEKWKGMTSGEKKKYLRSVVFKDPNRCKRVIDSYKNETIGEYDLQKDYDYYLATAEKNVKDSKTFNSDIKNVDTNISSYDASIEILNLFKQYVENEKGWYEIQKAPRDKEKTVQSLIKCCSGYYCKLHNIDLSFESNMGPGQSDVKASRGNDKTIIEVKLSSNQDYLNGFENQIEEYAKAEQTNNRIFLYVKIGYHPTRDARIEEKFKEKLQKGENPPYLFIIDSTKKESASVS